MIGQDLYSEPIVAVVYLCFVFGLHGCCCLLSSNIFPLNPGQELVPCVLLSFDDEQILTWRGHGWKSMYQGAPSFLIPVVADVASGLEGSGMP